MSDTLTPKDVLPRLPAWRGASWHALDGGLNNQTFKLEKDGRCAVLKIDSEPRRPPYNTRVQEAAVQAVAAEAGLATEVLHVGETVYLTDYVDGVVWSSTTFDEDRNLESLASALRRLHALPLSGRSFDAPLAARRYADRIEGNRALVRTCIDIIDASQTGRDICLCHNDLVAENIVSTPGIRFLDWEFASDNDPLFDIATVVEHHDLCRRQAVLLLDVYYGGDGARRLPDLGVRQRLYRALLWLWLAARRDSPPAELERVARKMATSDS